MKLTLFKVFIVIFLILLIAGAAFGYYAYQIIYNPNVSDQQESYALYIPTGASFDTVLDSLEQNKIVKDLWGFKQVAKQMKFPENIKAGKFKINAGESNRSMISRLRLGKQEAVKVTINPMRSIEKLAGIVGSAIEADSLEISQLLSQKSLQDSLGFESKTFIGMFLPDTYEFFWNTSAKAFIERMHKEYDKYWTAERKAKAEALNLSTNEVATLASIVKEEAYHNDEMPKIAGVYFNRLKKGMLLQADPTVKFALGDFTLKRIYTKHLETDSPYNTYLYPGLPPGPICMPSKAALDAVLNPVSHQYLYFCAKPDFSMYHSFAKSLNEHLRNARRYHSALNKKDIF